MIKIFCTFIAVFSFSMFLFSFESRAVEENTSPETAEQDVSIYKNDISKIETYLNSIKTLVAPFIQTSPENGKADGTFYLSRPGKLRWEYNPPTPVLVIAKGSLLTYYDSELNQVSHISLEDSLSGFLTRENISFNDRDVQILSFNKENNVIDITITQTNKEDEGQLTLKFFENQDSKISLSGMSVNDAIGKTTEISFTTLVYDKPLDKKLFILPKIKK